MKIEGDNEIEICECSSCEEAYRKIKQREYEKGKQETLKQVQEIILTDTLTTEYNKKRLLKQLGEI